MTLRIPNKKSYHFDVLLNVKGEQNHYAFISNFSGIVSSQRNRQTSLFICKACFICFDYQPRKYKLHDTKALAQY